ncbi:hypothetical protein BG58_18395 [Caballeronia jiangsuensis]|nr:hypothetical protein BG58_18395 [Caballeronia jiangsuensis]
MPTLNIIGAGRVGKTLGNLIVANRVLDIGQVYDRDASSAIAAVEFIGAGQPVDDLSLTEPADIWLLSVPDMQISEVARALACRCKNDDSSIAVHCSGALESETLAPLRAVNWSVASAHPVLSFADPGTAVFQFEGTPVGIEGDQEARDTWRDTLSAVGARCFEIHPGSKTLYHSAAVVASNFLPVLAALSSELWRNSGLPEALTLDMLRALIRNSVDNVLTLGPREALTGPASRGDNAVVESQARAIGAWDPACSEAYEALSILAGRLSRLGTVRAHP